MDAMESRTLLARLERDAHRIAARFSLQDARYETGHAAPRLFGRGLAELQSTPGIEGEANMPISPKMTTRGRALGMLATVASRICLNIIIRIRNIVTRATASP